MATARKIHTTTDAKTRSLELAHARGETSCSHAVKTLGWNLDERGALVSLALAITSATSDDTTYAVGYLAQADDASCDCTAASYGRPCWHRGLAIIKGRSVAYGYSPKGRAEAERDYLRDLELDDNARVLGFSH